MAIPIKFLSRFERFNEALSTPVREKKRRRHRESYGYNMILDTPTRGAIIGGSVIHPRGYLSKLYPYLTGSPPRHSVPVLYQNKLKRQERARHFTDGYTVRVYSNSFIEALHVLHETLATNNCFSAKACWHFLISETYRPVGMASVTHMFRGTLSERTGGRMARRKRRLCGRVDSHRSLVNY